MKHNSIGYRIGTEIDSLEQGIRWAIHKLAGKKAIIHYRHELRVLVKFLKYILVVASIIILTPIPDLELLIAPGIAKIFGVGFGAAMIITKGLAVFLLFLFAKNKLIRLFKHAKKFIIKMIK